MPKFEQIEVSPQEVASRLRPSHEGTEALERAANTDREYNSINLRGSLHVASMMGQSVGELGRSFKEASDTAQAHTDAMAELDANKQINDAEITAITGLNDAATPKSANGEPIEHTPGREGNVPLPLDASVPSPTAFDNTGAKTAADHSNMLSTFTENMFGARGVSQKAQDRINARIQDSQQQIRLHAAALGVPVAINHAIHTTDAAVNNSLSYIDQNPDQLVVGLQQIDRTITTAAGTLAGEAAIKGSSAFEEARTTARTKAVTMAVEAKARKGDVAGATAIMDKYPTEVGATREKLQTNIHTLANEASEAQDKQEAIVARHEKETLATKMGQAWTEYQPGMKMPDMSRTPEGIKHPQTVALLQDIWHRNEDFSLHQNQIDPNVSEKNTAPIRQEMLSDTGNPDVALQQGRHAYANGQINKAGYDEITQLYKDPSAKATAKGADDWLKRGGETMIDRTRVVGDSQSGSALGQQAIERWRQDYAKRVNADPTHAADLLNPTKPGNMVSPEALAPYRTTAAQSQAYDKQQHDLDVQADIAAGRRDASGKILDQAVVAPAKPVTAAAPGSANPVTAPMPLKDELGRVGGPNAAPITVPMNMSLLTQEGRASAISDMLKQYQPGTRVNTPDGRTLTIPPAGATFTVEGKTYTVPGKKAAPAAAAPAAPVQKMNYTPGETQAPGAVSAALGAPGKGNLGGPAGGTPMGQKIAYSPPATRQAPVHAASVRNNNPGAQWPNALAKEYGSTGHQNLADGNKIATFPTPIHGAAANMALVDHKYVGMTISSIQKTWSGQHRAALPGYPPNTRVTTEMAHDPAFMVPFMKAMADAEAPHGSSVMTDAQWKQAFDMYESKSTQRASL